MGFKRPYIDREIIKNVCIAVNIGEITPTIRYFCINTIYLSSFFSEDLGLWPYYVSYCPRKCIARM